MVSIVPPESLVDALKPWADFYSHSKLAVTVVTFAHVGAMLLAGGLAISSDRSSLRALRLSAAEDRRGPLRELAAVHRWVITGLVIVVVSGLVMLAADLETFFGSWIFWTKMALFVLLLVNGLVMTRAERNLATAASDATGDETRHWRALGRASRTSLALWFIITLAGVALVNFS